MIRLLCILALVFCALSSEQSELTGHIEDHDVGYPPVRYEAMLLPNSLVVQLEHRQIEPEVAVQSIPVSDNLVEAHNALSFIPAERFPPGLRPPTA